MPRKLALLALVLFAFTASARVRAVAHPELRPDGGTVSGTVSRVDGNLIEIAGGAITINASTAKVIVNRGREGSVADIKPGMQLFAALQRGYNPGTPGLPAALVSVHETADATLSGAIESVDASARTFVLLHETIHVDNNTSFGGYRRDQQTSFADLAPNVIVHVQADNAGGRLVAREVLVVAPAPPQVGRLRGTVKTIGTESWTVENDQKEIVTLVVNAQTKILGSPKAGDTVDVLYQVDSAHNFVAISIVKHERVDPPKVVVFRGTVKTIGQQAWVVTVDGADKTFAVRQETRIMPGIVLGDRVGVTALQNDDGTLTALAIVKLTF